MTLSARPRRRGLSHPRLYDLLLTAMTAGRERRYRQRMLDLAGVGPGDAVLDIGCGTGALTLAAWHRAQPNGIVYGADASPPMLQRARSKARRLPLDASLHFLGADAVLMPLPDRMFDMVLMSTVMHMIPENERATVLGEAMRLLRPGGRLLVVDYGGSARAGHVAQLHAHRNFDLGTLRPLIASAGLACVDEGPLGWLSLAYLVARKPEALTAA